MQRAIKCLLYLLFSFSKMKTFKKKYSKMFKRKNNLSYDSHTYSFPPSIFNTTSFPQIFCIFHGSNSYHVCYSVKWYEKYYGKSIKQTRCKTWPGWDKIKTGNQISLIYALITKKQTVFHKNTHQGWNCENHENCQLRDWIENDFVPESHENPWKSIPVFSFCHFLPSTRKSIR